MSSATDQVPIKSLLLIVSVGLVQKDEKMINNANQKRKRNKKRKLKKAFKGNKYVINLHSIFWPRSSTE